MQAVAYALYIYIHTCWILYENLNVFLVKIKYLLKIHYNMWTEHERDKWKYHEKRDACATYIEKVNRLDLAH